MFVLTVPGLASLAARELAAVDGTAVRDTGSDGRAYRIDTFIRDRPNNTAISWPERLITVIVRDDTPSGGDAEILREQTAFDRGPQ